MKDFLHLKPTQEEKTAFKKDFEVRILTAAFMRGRISPQEYSDRTRPLTRVDLRKLASGLRFRG